MNIQLTLGIPFKYEITFDNSSGFPIMMQDELVFFAKFYESVYLSVADS